MKTKHIASVTASLLLVAILTLVLAESSNAQQRMRMTPEQQAKMLTDSLALDSTQTAKVLAIFTEQQQEMAKVREAHQDDVTAMRQAMTDMRKKTDEKIMAVLTDVQKARFQEIIKNRPMRGMGGMRGPRGNQ